MLDLCCGTGRHAVELAQRGATVTAVDRTRAYLAAARELAARRGVAIELVEDDMRRFRRPAAFDAIVNLWSNPAAGCCEPAGSPTSRWLPTS